MNPSQKRPFEKSTVTTSVRQQQQQQRRRTTYGTRSSTRETTATTTTPRPPSSPTEQKHHQQTSTKRVCRLPSRYGSGPVESIPESHRFNSITTTTSGSGSDSDNDNDSDRHSCSSVNSAADGDNEFDYHTTDAKESYLRSSRNRSRSRSESRSRSKGDIIRRRWRQGDYRYNPSPSIAKRRRMIKPLASSINGRAVVADDFLQFFQDPPQAAQLQDPRQRDEAIAVFLKQEALLLSVTSTTSTTSDTTTTISSNPTRALTAAASPKSSSPPPSYRKLGFTTKRINQFRIFVASQFLVDSLRRRARLSDRNYAFRIPYRPNSILFESLVEELLMKFSVAGHTSPSSVCGAASESALFKGATANSILGLYMILIYRAQEFKTFLASASATAQQQHDPWTPTSLSEIAMELLELDRAVCERYDRLHSVNWGRGEENDGVGGVGLGEGEEDREEGEGTRIGFSDIRSVIRRRGKNREEEVLDGELMENKDVDIYNELQEELLPILPEEQFVNKAELQNSDGDGGAHDQVYEDSLNLEEGAFVWSGTRDDLWEVMMVQRQTFQELTEEVVYLREEVAQLAMKGKSSQGDGDDGIVEDLKGEVARLQEREKMRELETKTKFREMEDKLALFQERFMKMMADKEN